MNVANQAETIDCESFCTLMDTLPSVQQIIDLRTGVERRGEHIAGSLHIPVDEITPQVLEKAMAEKGIDKNKPLYLLCQSGKRAYTAEEKLRGQCTHSLIVIEGGLNQIKQKGISLASDKSQTMSLERQVRIAAGSLVLAGVLLGAIVNPVFYGLSGFVGAGLIFAGVTDYCGMGLLLARMPWNK